MIHFGILDDHPLVVEGLLSLFKTNPEILAGWGTTTLADCEKKMLESPVDVLLLDIHLDQLDGIKLCRDFRMRFPALQILMLTSYAEPPLIKAAFQNGAAGYLLKNAGYREIQEAITTARSGRRYVQPQVQEILLSSSMGFGQTPRLAYIPTLTQREQEVLTLIVNEMTTQEIADKLFVTTKTVETHRTNLLQKLGARNVAGLVKIALEKGLV
ncbi:LuxR C-terminal-related transcriptional regulator [Arsenicibacter rosenii]|uniref:DNA-binding response regulator n=1 Tax=Arsenicibacter rosenii TaxID=1750698 RepID=A0A1S2V9R2_9BACT|nr:response regulator transcription factor [Arsenicibacter rosenii]OIN55453.1 hypothetical protein BLX24_30490 [Arsenicibacter rosenii]